MGGVEEGRLVAPPAAALRRYHPCEPRTLARGPVLRQSGRVFDPAVTWAFGPGCDGGGPLALGLVGW